MKMKNILAFVLAASIILALLPTSAMALSFEVKYVKTDITFTFHYYTVYTFGGDTKRSDEMSPTFNYHAYRAMSDEDKCALVKGYATAYADMKEQFGEYQATLMNEFVMDKSGWKDAQQKWAKKVSEKYYPELTDYFVSRNGRKSIDSLTYVSSASPTIDSWKEYDKAKKEFDEWFKLGDECTRKLSTYRVKANSIAFKYTSKELISLIVDNAMIGKPCDSFSDFIMDQIVSQVDESLNISNSIIECLTGIEVATKDDAVDLIGKLNTLMAIYENMANRAMDKCNQLSSRICSLHEEGVEENENYLNEIEENKTEKQNAADEAVNAAVTPIVPTPPLSADATAWDYTKVLTDAADSADGLYRGWASDFEQEYLRLSNSLNRAEPQSIGTVISPSKAMTTMDFVAWEQQINANYLAAIECRENNLEALQKYKTDCEKLFNDGKARFKNEIEPYLSGVIQYADNYIGYAGSYSSSWASDKSLAQSMIENGKERLNGCFSISIRSELSGSGKYTVDDLIERENKRLDDVTGEYDNWKASVSEIRGAAEKDAAEYLNYQNKCLQAVAKLEQADNDFNTVMESLSEFPGYDEQGFIDELNGFSDGIQFSATNKVNDKDPVIFLDEKYQALLKASGEIEKARGEILECTKKLKEISGESWGSISSRSYSDNLRSLNSGIRDIYNDVYNKYQSITVPKREEYAKLCVILNDVRGNGYMATYMYERAEALLSQRADLLRDRLQGNYKLSMHQSNAEDDFDYTEYRTSNPAGAEEVFNKHFTDEGGGLYSQIKAQYKDFVPATGLSSIGEANASAFSLMSEGDEEYDISIETGKTYDLSNHIMVMPNNATEKRILWSTSDYLVANVDEDGVVTGVSDGIAVITAKAYDTPTNGGDNYVRTITVKVGQGTPEFKWIISEPEISIKDGKVEAKASLGVYGSYEDDVNFILALYYKGKLIGMSYSNMQSDIQYTLMQSCSLPTGAKLTDFTAKVLRWSSLDDMSPSYDVISTKK